MQREKNLEEKINEFIGEEKERKLIIGRDFNLTLGELGDRDRKEGETERNSKDKVMEEEI